MCVCVRVRVWVRVGVSALYTSRCDDVFFLSCFLSFFIVWAMKQRRTGGLAEQANTTPYRVVALMCAACGFLSSAIAWSLLKGIDNSDTAATDNSVIGSTSTSKGSKGRTDIAADALELLLNSKRDDNGSTAVGSRGASSVENSGGSSNTNETKAPTTLWTYESPFFLSSFFLPLLFFRNARRKALQFQLLLATTVCDCSRPISC